MQWYAQGIVVMRERKHFRMRSDMAQGTVDDLRCAVNHVLSCHAFRLYSSDKIMLRHILLVVTYFT